MRSGGCRSSSPSSIGSTTAWNGPGAPSGLPRAGPRVRPSQAGAVPRRVLGRTGRLQRAPGASRPADAHAGFAIGPAERDRWLHHMRSAIEWLAPPPHVADALARYFDLGAEAMRNRD